MTEGKATTHGLPNGGVSDASVAVRPVTPASPTAEDFRRFDRADRWPPPLGEAAFHGLAGKIVRTIEPHSEADPASLLVSLLVAVGSAVGRGPSAGAEGDVHTTNLFAAIVGETSKARKGTSWGRVSEVVSMAAPGWGTRVCGGLSSGEGLIWQVRDPITTRRRARRNEKRDAGEEGYVLETTDEGVADKRLLIHEGEFASCLRVMRRETNTLSPIIRNLWDRGDVSSLTKNSPARATGAHVSLVVHIVAQELRRELTATDSANGFANRFLWVCAQRSKVLPDGGDVRPDELRPLAAQLAAAIARGSRQWDFRRDGGARTLWYEVYERLSRGRPGLLGAVTSRAEAQVLRLSVIYAVLDRRDEIGVEHLSAGLAVWKYCADSAAFIFGDRLGDNVADKILDALMRSGPDGMSRTDVSNLLARHENGERIEEALDLLERSSLIERYLVKTGGRPQERILVRDRSREERMNGSCAVSAGQEREKSERSDLAASRAGAGYCFTREESDQNCAGGQELDREKGDRTDQIHPPTLF